MEGGPPEEVEKAAVADGAEADLGWAAGTRRGQFLLSVLLGAVVLSLMVWNVPDSEFRDEMRPVLRPLVNSMAIDQSWSVFAPDPTTISIEVKADVWLADGRVETYTFPDGDDFFGAYHEYRWRKWERRVRLDRNDHLWDHTARWVARQFPGDQVDRVVLIRRFSETPEPGSGDLREWKTVEFFRLALNPESEAGEA